MALLLPPPVPTPLDYFEALVRDDDSLAFFEAAISVAQDEYPEVDPSSVMAEVDGLALRLKSRIAADASVMQKIRLLSRYFFRELGFAGNVNHYYEPENSYVHKVLQTRRGIPITLALLYIELAQQLGIKAHGVSFPGHFLVKLSMPQGEAIIDPCTGQSLSREELDERLLPYRRQQGLEGDYEVPLGLFLQSTPPREILARMLRNLKEIHRSNGDWQRLLPVMNRLVTLQPVEWSERRDRGLVLAELEHWGEAAADLQAYLEHEPQAADAAVLAERLDEVQRLARLH